MKTKIFLVIFIFAYSFSISAQENLFNKISEIDGVTSIKVSKSMLQFIPESIKINANGLDLSKLVDKLENVHIITGKNKDTEKELQKIKKAFLENKKYEEGIKISEKNTNIKMYFAKNKEKKEIINQVVMFIDEKEEFVIIKLDGNLAANDIKELSSIK